MIQKVKTCDCFLTASILVKNGYYIVDCCLSCVKFFVNLLDVAGIKERIFIECHRKHLHFHYSNRYNEFYFSDSDDTDFFDNDQEN